MGERSMKHTEVKKKKKTDIKAPVASTYQRPAITQPELVPKKKKPL